MPPQGLLLSLIQLVFLYLVLPGVVWGADCNSNGIDDTNDVAGGTSLDCNSNGVLDECEFRTVFSGQQVITTAADGAYSAIATDLDGDGDTDVLSASAFDNKIAWYANTNGLGGFGPPQIITTSASRASSVFATDLDGDGDTDVLSASAFDNKIAWYENANGLGGFGPQQIITTSASGASSVFATDLDGDGDVDVLSASASGYANIAWYENTNGLGGFGPQQIITTSASGASSVFATDLDGDGDADVLSAGYSKIAWYENTNGLGGFGAQQTITTYAYSAQSVFATDLDGDGDADVLSASEFVDKIAWYENTNGLGGFGPQQIITTSASGASSVFATDLDGDGDADVLSAGYSKIAWYENTTGLGGFGPPQVITTNITGASSVFATDLDGDADADVLTAALNEDKVAWYENTIFNDCNENGTHDECDIAHATSTDCDGNSLPDECQPDCNLNGTADECDVDPTDPDGNSVFSMDCNANNVPDECELLANNCNSNDVPDDCDIAGVTSEDCNLNEIPDECEITSGTAEDCNTNGVLDACEIQTVFSEQQVITAVPDGVSSVFAADLDGDRDLDVLSASYYGNTIAWYENTNGMGGFGHQQIITTSAYGARSVHAADLDGDGDIDVLSAYASQTNIAWYENIDGLGGFGPRQTITTVADGANSLFATDLDGDGDIDVLSASYYDDKIAWYENINGLGGFGPQQVITTAADGANSVFAADLDADGDIDVLSASTLDDKIAWYENTNGLGGFGPQQVITTAADGAISVFAADLDGDGNIDVLSASYYDDMIASYENTNGLGGFGPRQFINQIADGARCVIAADLDGDEDIDVLSGSYADPNIAWYENIRGLGIFGITQTIAPAGGGSSLFAADLDGDGDVDVLSRKSPTIAWYENTGDNCNGNSVPDDCERDFDADGLIDDCDPCAGGAASGDSDANGIVDLDDLTDLASCLHGPGGPIGVVCECFDFDNEGDSDVDLKDFAVFQQRFNH